MFAKRLKWFSLMIAGLAGIILIRLIDIQVVRADHYETLADRMLTRPVLYLPAPRGAIRDREGRLLVSDMPSSDIGVHYLLISELVRATKDDEPQAGPRPARDPFQSYLLAVARELRQSGEYNDRPLLEVADELREEIRSMWPRLAELTGRQVDDLTAAAARIHARVAAVKRVVRGRTPTILSIAEEQTLHSLITGVDEQAALRIRIELERPWLRVIPSSRRVAHQADALVHLLGRLGSAGPERIAADELRGDELRGLRSGDLCGVSGVERLAELELRGRRGRIIESIDRVVEEQIDPAPGEDVRLTIDIELQNDVYRMLADAVHEAEKGPNPTAGGAVVVIDASTSEVVALVSYPIYRYDEYNENYARLRDDARWVPLRSHALQNVYPPGSTCKVAALYGALADGIVTPNSTIHCGGYFRENLRNAFRCWIYNQYGSTHGPQNAGDAIRNSCNIYFYACGDRLGAERLGYWFRQFGLGRLTGTGLIEETAGIVPDERWIAAARPGEPRLQPSDAWNYSIGQGEISATPLQCANAAAAIAIGRWSPVTLVRDARGRVLRGTDSPPPHDLDERWLSTIRTGMFRVVNERGGTALRARIDHPDHVLCGKTGSAQAVPRPLSRRWTVEWPDGRREEVVGPVDRDAFLARYPRDERPNIAGFRTFERFPPIPDGGRMPSHAWFMGYTQHRDTPSGARSRGRVYAIAVLLEYAGSGGQEAGPLAGQVAERVLGHQPAWGRDGHDTPRVVLR